MFVETECHRKKNCRAIQIAMRIKHSNCSETTYILHIISIHIYVIRIINCLRIAVQMN